MGSLFCEHSKKPFFPVDPIAMALTLLRMSIYALSLFGLFWPLDEQESDLLRIREYCKTSYLVCKNLFSFEAIRMVSMLSLFYRYG